MPKGKIEAFCMAIIETNGKLIEALEAMHANFKHSTQDPNPLDLQKLLPDLASLEACIRLTRSNQGQLKGMLQEAYKKGV